MQTVLGAGGVEGGGVLAVLQNFNFKL
jgi:hypothetical protein